LVEEYLVLFYFLIDNFRFQTLFQIRFQIHNHFQNLSLPLNHYRRRFLFLTFLGSLATTYVTYAMTTSVESMSVVAPINGFFTLGCAYVWMAIYPAELFGSTVRSTACSFVFNAARLIAWVFPIIAGSLIHSFGGVANAALALGSVYVLGLVLPWFLPETQGEGLPH
jgi:hypothetical protein